MSAIALTPADARLGLWIIGMSCLLIGLAMLTGWLLGCIGQALAGPDGEGAEPVGPECAWCRPLGKYDDISILPSDCKCDDICEATWCLRRSVTA